jgi:hypothetical protein
VGCVGTDTYQLVEKKGPVKKKKLPHRGWKTRWCVLRGKYLNYFKKEGDSYPIGQINVDMGCSIRFCFDESINKKRHAILLRNSGAEYCLEPLNEDEAIDWIVSLRAAQYYSRGTEFKKRDPPTSEDVVSRVVIHPIIQSSAHAHVSMYLCIYVSMYICFHPLGIENRKEWMVNQTRRASYELEEAFLHSLRSGTQIP